MEQHHRTITDRSFRHIVAFLSGFSIMLIVTLGFEWYVLQPTSGVTVTGFVMVQQVGAWLAIAGLASAVIAPVLLYRRMRVPQLASVPSSISPNQQWVRETPEGLREQVWTFGSPGLQEIMARGQQGTWEDVHDILSATKETGHPLDAMMKDKEPCEYVGR